MIDIGAGCGETAMFYLLHGASKVVAIEGDLSFYKLLVKNFIGDDRVIPVYADVGHVKLDIEGAERGSMIATHNELRPVLKHLLNGIERIYKIEADQPGAP